MAQFFVLVPNDDGGSVMYPMKEWLRQNPQHIPPGMDATASTSRQLLSGLRRLGWSSQETPSDVRLIMPGSEAPGEMLDSVLDNADDEDESPTTDSSFGLEYQLRDFIAQNIGAVLVTGKALRLYVDHEGRTGVEYPTAVGRIDILAVDSSGAFFVFELKRARSPDHAIGQLARYMGWVKKTLGSDKVVNGVIVAKVISDSLRYAVSVVPNVNLFEYEIEFHLKPAHSLPE